MDLFVRFLYDFLTLFFEGLKKIFLGLFTGIMDIFNLKRYKIEYLNNVDEENIELEIQAKEVTK